MKQGGLSRHRSRLRQVAHGNTARFAKDHGDEVLSKARARHLMLSTVSHAAVPRCAA